MMLIEETMVPDAVLPVEEFKAHLRLGSGFGTDSVQDAVLVSFLRAAVAAIEARTSKALIQRGFTVSVTAWAQADRQGLPVAPVASVDGMMLVDHAGARTPVAQDAFWLERDTHRPCVRAIGAALPQVPSAGSVEIAVSAGYGVQWDRIPADLGQAVMLLAAHYYEFRNETALSGGCMPFGVTSLIERYRPLRLGGGVR